MQIKQKSFLNEELYKVNPMPSPTGGRMPFDNYPTQTGVITSFLARQKITGTVCEPCANVGALSSVIQAQTAVERVYTNDIVADYNCDFTGDATDPTSAVWHRQYDWIVTNPPFNQQTAIMRNAWNSARIGIAFLLRITALEPAGKRSDYRGDFLIEHEDNMVGLLPYGQKRPKYKAIGSGDTATTAWLVWRKDWSWDAMGIQRPFQFVTNWML